MIEEQAVIIAIENLADKKLSIATEQYYQFHHQPIIAVLELMRHTPCGICGQTRGCGNSLWGKIFLHKSRTFKASNAINAKVGDSVIVGIDEQFILKNALLLYALPLAMMMTSLLLSTTIDTNSQSQKDLYAVIGAVIGLVLGFIWLKRHIASKNFHSKNQPVILRLSGLANL